MSTRADSDHRFYYRFIFIGLSLVGMGLWFLYDGAVTYPAQFNRADKYDELVKEKKVEDWPTVARENGWPTDRPKTPADAQVQYLFAGIMAFFALWCFAIVFLARGRWIEATKTGITSSWGQSLDFANVISLDKKQWKKKGIARVNYQDGNRNRTFVIDDYKFDREPTGKILKNLEDKLADELITGGYREGFEPVDYEPGEAEQDAAQNA